MAIRKLGLVKTSLVDYPGTVAATLFTHGCNLRCPYCHNPECVLGSPPGDFCMLEEVRSFMEKRKSILGGVCITGGEPFIHADLGSVVDMIRERGLKVKIDTNGTLPERIDGILVDYIDMDVKTSPSKYGLLLGDEAETRGEDIGAAVRTSVSLLRESAIPHRFRITAVPGILDEGDIREIACLIGPGELCLLSGFRPGITLDPSWGKVIPYTDKILDSYAEILRDKGIRVEIYYNRPGK